MTVYLDELFLLNAALNYLLLLGSARLGGGVIRHGRLALAAVLVRIVPTPKEERNLDQLLLVFTNLAFMGIPIIQALYGVEGVAMLSMFLLVFNFLVFTYGVMLLDGSGDINLRRDGRAH